MIDKFLNDTAVSDTSAIFPILKALQQFKIPGIGSILIKDDFTLNHKVLYNINFPEELIPEEYLCSLSSQVMTQVGYLKANSSVKFDCDKFLQAVHSTGKNPFTNLPITQEDMTRKNIKTYFLMDSELQEKIHSFVTKAIKVKCYFPKEDNKLYLKFKEDILGTCSEEAFNSKLAAYQAELQVLASSPETEARGIAPKVESEVEIKEKVSAKTKSLQEAEPTTRLKKSTGLKKGFFNTTPQKANSQVPKSEPEWEPTDKFDFYKPRNM